MDTSHKSTQARKNSSVMKFELGIIRARNVENLTSGTLFVRFYLQTGAGDKKIRLNTKEIPATGDPQWNETLFLECAGEAAAAHLRRQTVVFELRRRNPTTIIGRMKGSELMGRVEISWKDVLESPAMVVEDWFPVWKKNWAATDSKPPAIRVRLAVSMPETVKDSGRGIVGNRRAAQLRDWDKCGCRNDGCSCRDREVLAGAEILGNFW